MDKKEKIFVNSKELSRLISIPVYSIQKMVREKTLPAYSLNRRRFLFNLNEVLAIIKNSKIN